MIEWILVLVGLFGLIGLVDDSCTAVLDGRGNRV